MSDPPAVNERIARRRAEVRAGRRRRRLRRTVIVVVVAAVVAGLVALERSSLVALADLEVTGVERLAEEDVVAAAGVHEGMSVLRIRIGAVTERVEAMPLVDDAEVSRVGALGLRIEVDETAPVVTARFPSATLLVSENGVVLGEGEAPGTPVVEVRGPAPDAGDRVGSVPALEVAHEVLLGLPGPLAALVERADARATDDLRLVLEGDLVVRWGDATRSDEKARALGAVLEDLGGRTVSAIDVRAPMAPTVTP